MQSLDFTSTIFVSPWSEHTSEPSSSTYTSCGFRFWIKAERCTSAIGDLVEIYLLSEPEAFCADSYELLVDYGLTLLESDGGNSNISIAVPFEPVTKGYSNRPESERWTLRIGFEEAITRKCITAIDAKDRSEGNYNFICTVRCELRIRELLTSHKENYNEESLPRRDFALLLGRQRQLFVDLQYLADQGSEYFQDLLKSKQRGVRRAVLMNVEASEMEIFLHAVCTHRKAIITNRNFHVVLRLAQELCVDKVLRACEAYLLETEAVHPIRKLEYAAEFGLGLLGETIVRRLTNDKPMTALYVLHEYMHLNDETVEYMHPDVLHALNVFEDYVIL